MVRGSGRCGKGGWLGGALPPGGELGTGTGDQTFVASLSRCSPGKEATQLQEENPGLRLPPNLRAWDGKLSRSLPDICSPQILPGSQIRKSRLRKLNRLWEALVAGFPDNPSTIPCLAPWGRSQGPESSQSLSLFFSGLLSLF